MLLAEVAATTPWYEIIVTSLLTLAARQGWSLRRYLYNLWDWCGRAVKFAQELPAVAEKINAALEEAERLPEMPVAAKEVLADVRAAIAHAKGLVEKLLTPDQGGGR